METPLSAANGKLRLSGGLQATAISTHALRDNREAVTSGFEIARGEQDGRIAAKRPGKRVEARSRRAF
jgi:hypothetical protein